MGVSYLGAARTIRVVTFRTPRPGSRASENSCTPSGDPGLRWGDGVVPKGTSDRRSDVAKEPARQCWPSLPSSRRYARCAAAGSPACLEYVRASFALLSHRSNAPTPPSRSHIFIRSASLPSIAFFRAARLFHRSATPIRLCKIAIHPTINDSSENPASPSSSTTRSAKPSTRSIFANKGAVSWCSTGGGVFQLFMRPAYAHPPRGWIYLPILRQAPENARLLRDPTCGYISEAGNTLTYCIPLILAYGALCTQRNPECHGWPNMASAPSPLWIPASAGTSGRKDVPAPYSKPRSPPRRRGSKPATSLAASLKTLIPASARMSGS